MLAGGYWWWNRPAPQPTLEQLPQADGSSLTRVNTGPESQGPGSVIAVMADASLTDKQLMALSRGGKRADRASDPAQGRLHTATASPAKRRWANSRARPPWSAASAPAPAWPGAGWPTQTDDKAKAVSVGFQAGRKVRPAHCPRPRPRQLAGGLERQPRRPESASFRTRSPRTCQTSISDYDITTRKC
jgi:hypothetical protein